VDSRTKRQRQLCLPRCVSFLLFRLFVPRRVLTFLFPVGVRAVIPTMLAQEARDGSTRGTIITIASNAAFHGAPEKAVRLLFLVPLSTSES
jgi:hypothetical protein